MHMKDLDKIFEFLNLIGQLKRTMRYGDLDSDRKDSSASHSWRLAVLCMLIGPQIPKLDILRAIKIALVHDLPEMLTGDTPYIDILSGKASKKQKDESEAAAMIQITKNLPDYLRDEIRALYNEYCEKQTLEAIFVKICDKLEGSYTSMNKVGLAGITHSNGFIGKIPEMDDAIKFVRKDLKKHCEKNGFEWLGEYDL